MPDRKPIAARGTGFDFNTGEQRSQSAIDAFGPALKEMVTNPLGINQPPDTLDAAHPPMAPDWLRNYLSDKLGRVFESQHLLEKLRLTAGDPVEGSVTLHGVDSGTPYHATADEFGHALKKGLLAEEAGPYEGLSVEALMAKLAKMIK